MEVPANLEVFVKRLSNYTKNNVRVSGDQPQANTVRDNTRATTGRRMQEFELRLPTNGVIDLETLVLTFQLGPAATTAVQTPFGAPRYPSQLLRSLVVECGGQRLTHPEGGHEYAQVYTMLQNAYGNFEKWAADAPFVGGGIGAMSKIGPDLLITTAVNEAGTAGGTVAICTVTGILGFLQGKFQRFLDLSLLPQIIVRFEANDPFSCWGNTQTADWDLVGGFRLSFDQIEFGDATYHQMLAGLLTRGPIEIPFPNYTWSEGPDAKFAGQSAVLERDISARSLDTVIGSLRYGYTEGAWTTLPGGTLTSTTPVNIVTISGSTPTLSVNGVSTLFTDNFTSRAVNIGQLPKFVYTSGGSAPSACFGQTAWPFKNPAVPNTAYQIFVGSKQFPTYAANVVDCAQLARNNANTTGANTSLGAMSHAADLASWAKYTFGMPVSFHHNGDQPGFTRRDLISGLDTNGYTKVRFVVDNLTDTFSPFGYKPVILTEVTSRLLVFPERQIQVEY